MNKEENKIYEDAREYYKETISGKAIKNPKSLESMCRGYAEFVLDVFQRKKTNFKYFDREY